MRTVATPRKHGKCNKGRTSHNFKGNMQLFLYSSGGGRINSFKRRLIQDPVRARNGSRADRQYVE